MLFTRMNGLRDQVQLTNLTSNCSQAVHVPVIAMLFLPNLIPRNVQQQTGDLDEELLLIQQEAQLKLEVRPAQ